jgi:hypothetical protein
MGDMTTTTNHPATMLRVVSLMIEARLREGRTESPEDRATNACLVQQHAYWQERAAG